MSEEGLAPVPGKKNKKTKKPKKNRCKKEDHY